MLRTSLLIAGLVGIFLSPAAAQAKVASPAGIAWQPSFEKARELAASLNRPIMLALVLPGESANETVIKSHFLNPKVVDLSRKFVCLVGARGLTKTREGTRSDGTVGQVSVELGAVSPKEVLAVEQEAREKILESTLVSAPQFIWFAPDGQTVLMRHVWMLPASKLAKKMQHCLWLSDPDNAPPEFKAERDLVAGLLKEAQGNNTEKRRQALRTLASTDDPRIVEWLVKRLTGRVDKQQRLETIFMMGQKGNAQVLPSLHSLLKKSKDIETRIYTCIALGSMAMRESAEPLLAAYKKERKDRGRAHILRALTNCLNDQKQLSDLVLKTLKKKSLLDRLTALHVLQSIGLNPELEKMVIKLAKNSNGQVRAASYVVIGSNLLQKAKPILVRNLATDKAETEKANRWALEQLGGEAYEGDDDPEALVYDNLPDNHLYEGDLDAKGDGRKGGGRGGRGGGRGGGGRGGRRR